MKRIPLGNSLMAWADTTTIGAGSWADAEPPDVKIGLIAANAMASHFADVAVCLMRFDLRIRIECNDR